MKPSTPLLSDNVSDDQDLIEQANPGHGIPSQDPGAAAQNLLVPQEAEREANAALVGGSMVAGVTTGTIVGVAVAGPAGSLAGAALGAVAGAAGGAAAGTTANPDDVKRVDKAPAYVKALQGMSLSLPHAFNDSLLCFRVSSSGDRQYPASGDLFKQGRFTLARDEGGPMKPTGEIVSPRRYHEKCPTTPRPGLG